MNGTLVIDNPIITAYSCGQQPMWSIIHPGRSDLIKKGRTLADQYDALIQSLETDKENGIRRQVDLWSVLTPSTELEHEYKEVSARVAYAIKRMRCLEEHSQALRLAAHHCEDGKQASCTQLVQLVKVADPCANITPEVPKVSFLPGVFADPEGTTAQPANPGTPAAPAPSPPPPPASTPTQP